MLKSKAEIMKVVGKTYNQRITIQKSTSTTIDDNGDPVQVWEDVFTNIPAGVSIKSGREFWASRKNNAEWDGLFKIRYRPGIDSTMRIIYGDMIFEITAPPIDPEEAHQELHIEGKDLGAKFEPAQLEENSPDDEGG